MNTMGYAAAIGNHGFSYGVPFLDDAIVYDRQPEIRQLLVDELRPVTPFANPITS